MMAAGLRAGLSADDFWHMSPRAVTAVICLGGGARRGAGKRPRRETGGAIGDCP